MHSKRTSQEIFSNFMLTVMALQAAGPFTAHLNMDVYASFEEFLELHTNG